jgi:hypothetical protein
MVVLDHPDMTIGPWARSATPCHNPAMHRPRRRPIAPTIGALALAVALVSAACGSTTSSPSASAAATAATEAEVLDEIERQVVDLRGLEPNQDVAREVIDEDRLRELLTASYNEESPPEYVAANERLYKALGLLPADADLKKMTLDMLSAGVAGFYRDDEKKMYVVSRSGSLTAEDRITYAHEFTHALQDQHFPVFMDQAKVLDRTDWLLARQAIYEGDASILMAYWAIGNLTQQELGQITQTGASAEQQAVLDAMPAILRETLLYPYTTGAFYVQATQMTGGWPAVDAYYSSMPESTEQILHKDKYSAGEAPVTVTLPESLATDLGAGWSVPLKDTFGEFQMGIWLREGGVEKSVADAAAAGWGGDRLAVLEGPDGAWAVAMHTTWDTPTDAVAFDAAARTALERAGGPGQVLPGEDERVRWVLVADEAGTLEKVARALDLAG